MASISSVVYKAVAARTAARECRGTRNAFFRHHRGGGAPCVFFTAPGICAATPSTRICSVPAEAASS
eukprot:scaffold1247_cov251-Pinguiococcus_pyrenoidosus.AAC.6